MKVNKKINLKQLDDELNGKGLNGVLDADNNIIEVELADGNDATQEQLKTAIENHIAMAMPEPTLDEKLGSVGLSIDDLKAALGL